MDQNKLIKRLLPLITSENHWDNLEDYLVFERDRLTEILITSNDIKSINRIQGQILQLKTLLELPDKLKKL
jgi:hypothetical protein|tara:strand:- start:413 stop:625 length:213 start_codon:yes stop_codon:yes gene_type:complete